MNPNPRNRPGTRHRRLTGAAVAATAVILAACGGGGGVLAPGSGGTGTNEPALSFGPISGFGSIIVNGIRYDDSAATIVDDSGRTIAAGELRLGMMVQVSGAANAVAGTGAANAITVFSELKGFVDSVTADQVVVAGRTVRLNALTVRDGFGTLVAGDFVEVYAYFDAGTGEFTATRIERKTPDDYKLRGVVTALDSVQQRFSMGSTTVDYSGASLPAGFAIGQSVRVYASSAPAGGILVATSVRLSDDLAASVGSGSRVELEGLISGFVSRAEFRVNGLPVDALNATIDDGTVADLVDGALVEVEGTLQDGRLVATRLEFESSDGSGSGGSSGSSSSGSFEIHGRVTAFTSLASFTVRNTRIDASADGVVFDRGSVSDLGLGSCVEVDGMPTTDAQGTVLRALEVKFDDDCV